MNARLYNQAFDRHAYKQAVLLLIQITHHTNADFYNPAHKLAMSCRATTVTIILSKTSTSSSAIAERPREACFVFD